MNNKLITNSGCLVIAFMLLLDFAFANNDALHVIEEREENFSQSEVWSYNSFQDEITVKDSIWGKTASDRFYLGMFTLHFEPANDHQNNNQLISLTWGGLYAGTFINSHNARVYSVGVQRSLYRTSMNDFNIEAGYRFGLMYCPERYHGVLEARYLPLPQLVADIDYKERLGIQFSWAGVVLTAGFSFRF